MPDKMRGFKMEPKGAYAKMTDSRGIPKYGLPKNGTVDFSNPKIVKAYKENKEFRDHLKNNRGITYDDKTKKSEEVKPLAKMEEPLKDMHLKKMEDDAMKAMRDPVAKMKEPMAAMKDPMAKMDPIKKYEEAMPKMMDPAKKMRTGSLMRKDYGLQNKATVEELHAAKRNAVANGFDPKVAEDVFAKYEVK